MVTTRVSLVATVLNERASLEPWLTALEGQTRLPDEIVIVDGGSTDGTWEALNERSWLVPVQLHQAHGATIAAGRNVAIALATHGLIVVTDAGTEAEQRWLDLLVRTLENGHVDVASGFFTPRLDSPWSRALAATTLPDRCEVNGDRFQPSSRSMAFRKAWWEAGVRYPEWLDYGEDLVWDMAMRRAGARFVFVPEARVLFAVRPTAKSFAVQYLRYARGDGKAGIFLTRHLARYLTYSALLTVITNPSWRVAMAGLPLAVLYVRAPLVRLWRRDRDAGLSILDSIVTIPRVVALRSLGDFVKMVGYPLGLAWRVRRYGARSTRITWKRVSPSEMVLTTVSTRESPQPTSSRGVGSPEVPL